MGKKRRKRTSRHVPAKGRIRNIADKLWSTAILADWDRRCAVCGVRGLLNSHHLIPRSHQATRYDLRNGICLCRPCHIFNEDVSPHLNAAGWLLWLAGNHPERHRWYVEMVESGKHKRFDGTTNANYYIDVIRGLKEYIEDKDYIRILGMRFAAYMESQE